MIISSKSLREELELRWSDIYVLTTDKEYTVPDKEVFRQAAIKAKAEILKDLGSTYIAKIYECEDISKVLIGRIIENRVRQYYKVNIPAKGMFSWPFGICFGTQFNGWIDNHWAIIAYASGNVYLLDSQTVEMWRADIATDHIMFALI